MKKSWRELCLQNQSKMFARAHAHARRRALKKCLPFSMTHEYIKQVFDDQNGKCFYSGKQLNIVKEDADILHDPFKMTIDCLDPKLGYVKGNIVWCAYCINSLKQKMNVHQMVDVCKAIVECMSTRM